MKKRHVKSQVSWEEWKRRAQKYADDVGIAVSLWDEDDPCEILSSARSAFAAFVSPKAFVDDEFCEDLARMEGEEVEAVDSMTEDE